MSAHDFLCCEIRRVLALLDEYGEEFDPPGFNQARQQLKQAELSIYKFASEEDLK